MFAPTHQPIVAEIQFAHVRVQATLKGVALYGSLAGHETSHDERNWQANHTILVTGGGTNSSAVLDGFTAGQANGNRPNDRAAGCTTSLVARC